MTLEDGSKYEGEWNEETGLKEGRGYEITKYGNLY